jgi:hypothetical protein
MVIYLTSSCTNLFLSEQSSTVGQLISHPIAQQVVDLLHSQDLQKSDFYGIYHQIIVLFSRFIENCEMAVVALTKIPEMMHNMASPKASPTSGRFVHLSGSPDPQLHEFILFLLAKSAATTAQGGNLSEFEKDFAWVIQPSMNMSPDDFEIPAEIVGKIENLDPVMDFIYSRWKPAMNRNLSGPLRELDKFCLCAVYKHLCPNWLSIFEIQGEIPTDVGNALEIMMQTRGTARRRAQAGEENAIANLTDHCRLFLALKSEFRGISNEKERIASFLRTTLSCQDIREVILCQRRRIAYIRQGFDFSTMYSTEESACPSDRISRVSLYLWNFFSDLQEFEILKSLFQFAPSLGAEIFQSIYSFLSSLMVPVGPSGPVLACASSHVGLVVFRILRDCNQKSLNSLIFGTVVRYRQNPIAFALCLLTVKDSENLPVKHFADCLQFTEREWILLTLYLETHPFPQLLAMNFKHSFDRCQVKFTKYLFKAASFLEDGDAEFEKKFESMLQSNLRTVGNKAAWFELEGDDFQFLDLFNKFLDGRSVTLKNLILNAILELKPESADSFAYGDMTIFTTVRFDDSMVSFLENGQTINALIVKDKIMKGQEWLVYCDLSRALFAPDQIARRSHDFSALTSDPRISERLCLLFDHAVKSRESVSHYLTIRAVYECLKNEAFVEFARLRIHVDTLVAFLGSFYGLDELAAQWKLYCRCKKLDSSEDLTFDYVITADKHFYISQNLRKGGHAEISIRAPEPVAIEFGFVEESDGDELFGVIASRTFDSVPNLSIVLNGAASFSAHVGGVSIPIPDTRRPRLFITSESQLHINILTAVEMFQTTTRFIDRFASGRFGLSPEPPFLELPEPVLSQTRGLLEQRHPLRLSDEIAVDNNTIRTKSQPCPLFKDPIAMTERLRSQLACSHMKKMTETALSMTVMKLFLSISDRPIPLDLALRLFVHLVVGCQIYDFGKYCAGKFPFSMKRCLWDADTPMRQIPGLDPGDVRSALRMIIAMNGFSDYLKQHLLAMATHNDAHFPISSVLYHGDIVKRRTFFFVPAFGANRTCTAMLNDTQITFPKMVLVDRAVLYNASAVVALFQAQEHSVSWIYRSPFEFLLLLKNFLHLAKAPNDFMVVRMIFYDAILLDSPFLRFYADKFLNRLFQQSHDLCEGDIEYCTKVALLMGRFDSLSPNIQRLVAQDSIYLGRDRPIMQDFGPYFPEFGKFSGPVPQVDRPFKVVSPFCSESPAELRLLRTRSLLSHSDELSDFPFWIALPIWLSVTATGGEVVEILSVRDDFVSDCRWFVLKWTDEHSRQLVCELPRSFLEGGDLGDFESGLTQQFPVSVVRFVATAIREVNMVFMTYRGKLGRMLADLSFASYFAFDGLLRLFAAEIISVPDRIELTVDRRRARHMIDENLEAGSYSVVAQVTARFARLGPGAGRGLPVPWHVHFNNESAVDAGGVARELLHEFADSIFQQTTRLMIPTPTSPELFVPFHQMPDEAIMQQYRMIGAFLGMIARTGICQPLPFAPLVWKFVTREPIGESDIARIDTALGQVFKQVREAADHLQQEWKVTTWTGTLVQLPGRTSTVKQWEVETFVSECVAFRMGSIERFLDAIRDGFYENIGLKSSKFLSSYFLSRACQGDEFVTVEDLRKYTQYSDFVETDMPVQLLWQVIEKMTNHQRSLYLRFITTLTRLPIRLLDQFRITVQRMTVPNPNRTLVTASTCFNRLYLPCYTNITAAWDKIILAIGNCPTMDKS